MDIGLQGTLKTLHSHGFDFKSPLPRLRLERQMDKRRGLFER